MGDLLIARDGQMLVVHGVSPSGAVETVYNWRIADYHTYFVAPAHSGLSVWAHNACSSTSGNNAASSRGRAAHKAYDWGKGYKKEVTLPSGKRVDALNRRTRTIGELKPNNPRARARGERQLAAYKKELEALTRKRWKTRLEVY